MVSRWLPSPHSHRGLELWPQAEADKEKNAALAAGYLSKVRRSCSREWAMCQTDPESPPTGWGHGANDSPVMHSWAENQTTTLATLNDAGFKAAQVRLELQGICIQAVVPCIEGSLMGPACVRSWS